MREFRTRPSLKKVATSISKGVVSLAVLWWCRRCSKRKERRELFLESPGAMHIDLMRMKEKVFPNVETPLAVRSLRIWHCNYKSLASLGEFANLETLVVATWPDDSFDALAGLDRLRYLSILHFPRSADLSPLAGLHGLETLRLYSLPSWDASGKVLEVLSLAPITQLANLQHLELFGVCPPERRLPIEMASGRLRTARFSNYPESEIQRFHESTGTENAGAPAPTYHAA